MPIGSHNHRAQRGVTFVTVLLLLALAGLGLAAVGPLWSQTMQRDRERDLLRIGTLYAQAIADYRDHSPGSIKHYPLTLEALTLDTRFVGIKRHMRQLYPDPLSPERPWGLVRDERGAVTGVYSLSLGIPLQRGRIDLDIVELAPAASYADWKFIPKAKS